MAYTTKVKTAESADGTGDCDALFVSVVGESKTKSPGQAKEPRTENNQVTAWLTDQPNMSSGEDALLVENFTKTTCRT